MVNNRVVGNQHHKQLRLQFHIFHNIHQYSHKILLRIIICFLHKRYILSKKYIQYIFLNIMGIQNLIHLRNNWLGKYMMVG
jgi:uncharacterized membrane protein YwaF